MFVKGNWEVEALWVVPPGLRHNKIYVHSALHKSLSATRVPAYRHLILKAILRRQGCNSSYCRHTHKERRPWDQSKTAVGCNPEDTDGAVILIHVYSLKSLEASQSDQDTPHLMVSIFDQIARGCFRNMDANLKRLQHHNFVSAKFWSSAQTSSTLRFWKNLWIWIADITRTDCAATGINSSSMLDDRN